ncbi:MAG: hypothetical protein HUU06_09550, partial [Planctomycetaceae bacterium]|nr:hypothetical protein [Planctomycetaceae bacterium]
MTPPAPHPFSAARPPAVTVAAMRKEMDLSGGRDRAFECRNCLHTEDESARGRA